MNKRSQNCLLLLLVLATNVLFAQRDGSLATPFDLNSGSKEVLAFNGALDLQYTDYKVTKPKVSNLVYSGQEVKSYTIEELRLLSAVETTHNKVYASTNPGMEGLWKVDSLDTSSLDNLGTVLVTTSGKRIKRIFDSAVSVKWFGAKGDGITNDAVAFNNAVSFLNGKHKTLFIPQSTYIVNSTIEIPQNSQGIKFIGEGAWTYTTSRIKSSASIIINAKCQGFTMSNMLIEGAGTNVGLQLKRNDVSNEGDDFYNDIDCEISNSGFENVFTGIHSFGRQIIVHDNYFSGIKNGVIIDHLNQTGNYGGPVRAIKIWRNQFHSVMRDVEYENSACIWIKSPKTYGVSILNNFEDSFGTFFKGYLVDGIISNNEIYHLLGYGIYADSIAGSQIIGNNFIQSDKYRDDNVMPPYSAKGGVYCKTQVSRSNISNNVFPPGRFNVIKFLQGASGVNIRDNQFNRWGILTPDPNIPSAIQLDSANSITKSSNVIVEGNKFYQGSVPSSYVLESHTTSPTIILDKNQILISPITPTISVTDWYFPNIFPKLSFMVIRNLASGENINTLTTDVCIKSGIYVVQTNLIASGITGLPVAQAGILEVIATTGTVTYRTYKIIRSSGHSIYYQNISGGIVSPWVKANTYKSVTTHTYDLASLSANTSTSATFTVTGAAIGDPIEIDVSLNRQGIFMWGYVESANTVRVYFENKSASTIDLASATYTIRRE